MEVGIVGPGNRISGRMGLALALAFFVLLASSC